MERMGVQRAKADGTESIVSKRPPGRHIVGGTIVEGRAEPI